MRDGTEELEEPLIRGRGGRLKHFRRGLPEVHAHQRENITGVVGVQITSTGVKVRPRWRTREQPKRWHAGVPDLSPKQGRTLPVSQDQKGGWRSEQANKDVGDVLGPLQSARIWPPRQLFRGKRSARAWKGRPRDRYGGTMVLSAYGGEKGQGAVPATKPRWPRDASLPSAQSAAHSVTQERL